MIKRYLGHRPDLGILILRIILGVVFIANGYNKFAVVGIDNVAGFFGSVGIPAALFFAWVVALIELLGGVALIVGYGSRLAAFLLGIVMIVAILTVKLDSGLLGPSGYQLDLGLLAGLVAIVFGGSGQYSVEKE